MKTSLAKVAALCLALPFVLAACGSTTNHPQTSANKVNDAQNEATKTPAQTSIAKAGEHKDDPSLPVCASNQLFFSLDSGDGAAGSVYYPLSVSNRSSQKCKLPTINEMQFLDGDLKQIGLPIKPTKANPEKLTVVLAPGESAQSVIRVSSVLTDGCKAVQVNRLRIILPDDQPSLAFNIKVCQDRQTAEIYTGFGQQS